MVSSSIVWTNHALLRLRARKLSRQIVEEAVLAPDKTLVNKKGSTEYHKIVKNQTIVAVVKKNEKGEGVVVSAWCNPPNPGTRDFRQKKRYYQMQNASFAKKLWLTFLDQIGL
ncbi:MAG: hypothetical protein COX79_04070 [Candidatus Levybacteria bacterium CG_4_10_14_0_2_um_filter_36_16]|nr:MAG: hypothetical protein AUK12_04780 [Candidatus Levybacteria bacterium CG2_30_37_29]PIR79008.1 MAG: hypothetical protein COU26_03485 [Candidatus Levybacteria bacterium CG10_big_fil_rev_8_21_14_0_10_36_30]PIZ96889.1 MAG: hypothetical protein COX79_04070 [Candidatus Levybacteria bacterium CG_4_10_14_0_2_um_filter_36_16]PJA90922.1 MAG: hypothetical protein CO136_00115 [Candidatus Levybacteria bacterium CG_4_9_14_3_um_filter_36_7]